ncbi:hypothetical protein ACFOD4_00615 [Pseudoroseomonas globiformis]|uniref:Uncharacterized protein n=1 Tax=Teichococcus globiformis TaxID=2307229 RepID=A0ABV7FWJ1_9PROT
MCESPVVSRFTEEELVEITRRTRTLPGRWTLFPHVDQLGEVTLLLTPALWEDQDAGFVLQREMAGIAVLMTDGDDVTREGLATGVDQAMKIVWERALFRSASLAEPEQVFRA